MINLSYTVAGQLIEPASVPQYLVADTVGVYQVAFTFDADWDTLGEKKVVFRNPQVIDPDYRDVPVEFPLDANGQALVPAALLDPGKLFIGVYGANSTQQFPTIWAPPLQVVPGASPGVEPSDDPALGTVIRTIPQTLTEEEKAQARENIGANEIEGGTAGNVVIIDNNLNIEDSGLSADDLSSLQTEGINLYDPAQATAGYHVSNTTGNLVAYSTWSVSDYIPAQATIRYRLLYLTQQGEYAASIGSNLYWAAYKSDKTFLQGGIGDGITVESADLAYIRVSAPTARMGAKTMVIAQQDVRTDRTMVEADFIPYGESFSAFASDMLNLLSSIAPVEKSWIATQNYAVGDYLIVRGKLYKVTVAISNTGAIIPGTNVDESPLSDAVTAMGEWETASITINSTYLTSANALYCRVNRKLKLAVLFGWYTIGTIPSTGGTLFTIAGITPFNSYCYTYAHRGSSIISMRPAASGSNTNINVDTGTSGNMTTGAHALQIAVIPIQ